MIQPTEISLNIGKYHNIFKKNLKVQEARAIIYFVELCLLAA